MQTGQRAPAGTTAIAFSRTIRGQVTILGIVALVMWFLEVIDQLILGRALDGLGVRPRLISGLRGILFMPFLHDGIGHLLANTVPFLFLGWLVMLRRTADFFIVTAVAMLVSGLGVWLFGQPGSVHLGASGLVFGYFGYLLMRATIERSLAALSLALIVLLMYGSLIWGVLPMQRGVSWQGHLFGMLGGLLAAYVLAERRLAADDDDDEIEVRIL
jgi:membrane associated rhomboid family serine protease